MKKIHIVYGVLLFCIAILALMPAVNVRFKNPIDTSDGVSIGKFVTITIGPDDVYAAPAPDYTCTGANDDVPFQAAINALPATGGKLQVLGGTYVFANLTSVTRAIDNITIEGVGRGTYFTGDGVTPEFICGGNNWVFKDIRTDAGGITVGVTTGWQMINVDINGTLYAYRDPYNNIVGGTMTVTALNTNGKLTAGANEIEGSNIDWNGGDMSAGTISGGLTWSSPQDLNSQALTNINADSGDMSGVDATFGAGTTLSTVGGTVTSDTTDDIGESKKENIAYIIASDAVDVPSGNDAANGRWVCNGAVGNYDDEEVDAALTAGYRHIVLSQGTHYWDSMPSWTNMLVVEGTGPDTTIELDADISPFLLSGLTEVVIKNLRIDVNAAQTNPIIEVSAIGDQHAYYNTIENIWINNGQNGVGGFDAIELHAESTAGQTQTSTSIVGCKFSNIRTDYWDSGHDATKGGVNRLLYLHTVADVTKADVPYINGNSFNDMFSDGFVALVEIADDGVATNTANYNYFENIKGQSKSYTTDGFKGIQRYGNTFVNCMVWDWALCAAPNYIWSIDSGAAYTNIYMPGLITLTDIDDDSDSTTWIVGGSRYSGSARLITVGTSGCMFNKISDAITYLGTQTLNSANHYTIHVYGDITETSQITFPAYTDWYGFGARVTTTVASLDNHNISQAGIANELHVSDIEFIKTGNNVNSYAVLYCSNASTAVQFHNCTFTNDAVGAGSSPAMNIFAGSITLDNCILDGDDSVPGNIFFSYGATGFIHRINNGVYHILQLINHASITDGGGLEGTFDFGMDVPAYSRILTVHRDPREAFRDVVVTNSFCKVMLGDGADEDRFDHTVDPGDDIWNLTTIAVWADDEMQASDIVTSDTTLQMTFAVDVDFSDIVNAANGRGCMLVSVSYIPLL